MDYIKLIPRIFAEDAEEAAVYYDHCGADELFYKAGLSEGGQDEDIRIIKRICRTCDLPVNVLAPVSRFEDIKKLIYAGARRVFVEVDSGENLEAVKEAAGRFGNERICRFIDFDRLEDRSREALLTLAEEAADHQNFGGIVLSGDPAAQDYCSAADYLKVQLEAPVFLICGTVDKDVAADLSRSTMPDGIIFDTPRRFDAMEMKLHFRKLSLPVNSFESSMDFKSFKLNSDGMIPCITQDYQTGQVLMLAYMTKESFEKTVETGKMTYYSRSRRELWTKGDTSGHYQYVKSMTIDCDKDTILAKVAQVGAACHTGNRSCFFTPILEKEYNAHNPLEVFEQVFATIQDRKDHPKEGSYTNYLFEKGIDKILKKCGEEATEIVIAAKNPDSDELKYEICDFLYHMMVLMAERGLTWKEITDELAERH